MGEQILNETEEQQAQEISRILSENLELTQQLETSKERIAAQENQIEEMETWIASNRTDLMSDIMILKEKQEEIRLIQRKIEEKEASIEDSKLKIAVREKKVLIREKEAEKTEKYLNKREERICDREYAYGSVEAELEALDNRHSEIAREKEKNDAVREQLRRHQQTIEYERKKIERDRAALGDVQGHIYTVEGQIRDRYRHMTKIYKVMIGLLSVYAGVLSLFVYLS